MSEHGVKLVRGGYRERKRKKPTVSSPPPEKKPNANPEKKPRLALSDPQPATNLAEPKANNSILIHDDIYVNKTFGEPTPDMFHAVWSSTDGFWSPHMWVGPVRNIVPTPRGSIKPRVVQELLEEQESKCRLCRTDVFMGTYSNSEVDHIIPLSYGGSCSKSNLQILCVTCHRRKTALECKKVFSLMGSVNWEPDKVYISNAHAHYEPELIRSKNPKAFPEENSVKQGLYVLDY